MTSFKPLAGDARSVTGRVSMDELFSSRRHLASTFVVFCLMLLSTVALASAADSGTVAAFPIPLAQYNDASIAGLAPKLLGRI